MGAEATTNRMKEAVATINSITELAAVALVRVLLGIRVTGTDASWGTHELEICYIP